MTESLPRPFTDAPPRSIDLNCDLGESFGAWHMGADEAVMPYVSSANVACGFHAGDPRTMLRTVELARDAGVAIGAHVALPDLQGFGRREMRISPAEAHAMTLYQLGALAGFTRAARTFLRHVKPHGALYNMAARDAALADAIAAAVRDFDPMLVRVGLAGSELPRAGERHGLAIAHEAFTDRRYRADGSLVPRDEAGALIDDIEASLVQALAIARGDAIATQDGAQVRLCADTLCVHGDHPDAPLRARRLHEALSGAGLRIAATGSAA
jgi:5-oxoprolinase (ATP-hydrolysing) subunit A